MKRGGRVKRLLAFNLKTGSNHHFLLSHENKGASYG